MNSYKDLDLWIKGKSLVIDIYNETKGFPKEEQFGLVSQLRKASVSIVASIAEGHGRSTAKETIHFLHISRGSLFELESLLIVSNELEFVGTERSDEIISKITDCVKMINGLIKYFELRQ